MSCLTMELEFHTEFVVNEKLLFFRLSNGKRIDTLIKPVAV